MQLKHTAFLASSGLYIISFLAPISFPAYLHTMEPKKNSKEMESLHAIAFQLHFTNISGLLEQMLPQLLWIYLKALDYCNTVYMDLPLESVQKSQVFNMWSKCGRYCSATCNPHYIAWRSCPHGMGFLEDFVCPPPKKKYCFHITLILGGLCCLVTCFHYLNMPLLTGVFSLPFTAFFACPSRKKKNNDVK